MCHHKQYAYICAHLFVGRCKYTYTYIHTHTYTVHTKYIEIYIYNDPRWYWAMLWCRHSFLHSVEPLDGSACTRRLTVWSNHLQTTPHKLSLSPKESLPPGSSEAWPTWSSLNRLCTGTGRCKSLNAEMGI